jgi:hypothetical protein
MRFDRVAVAQQLLLLALGILAATQRTVVIMLTGYGRQAAGGVAFDGYRTVELGLAK